MITKNDFDASMWQVSIDNCQEKTCDQYFSIFKQEATKAYEAGELTKSEVFRLLHGLTSMLLDPSNNQDNPFHPMMTFTDGTRTMTVDDFTEAELDIFAEIVEGVTDSEMQARIADILWIRRRIYQMAILASNAYIVASKNESLNEESLTPISWRLERAIQLARVIGKKDVLDSAFLEIERVLQTFKRDEDLLSFVPITMMNIMQKYKYTPNRLTNINCRIEPV